MNCPLCAANSRVIDSRDTHHSSQVRRRRECMTCRARWTTYETIVEIDGMPAGATIDVAAQAFTIHQQTFHTAGAAHERARSNAGADRQQPGRQRDEHANDHRTKVDPIARDRAAVQRILACGDFTHANPPQPLTRSTR